VRPTWKSLPYVLQRTFFAAFDDGCFWMAKGAAYSAILSFFPILTSAATILVMTNAAVVSDMLAQFLQQIVPPGTERVVLNHFRARGQKSITLLVIAALLSLWAAGSVFKSLIQGFNAAYRIPRSRSYFRETGVAIMLVFFAAVPLAGASAMVLFGSQAERAVLGVMHVDPLLNPLAGAWHWISLIARYVVAFAAIVAITCILYYYGPYRRQKWSGVWRGALLATALWLAATMGFAWYVRHLAPYNVMYGSIGTSIALLVWMYLMAVIAMFGCEFNAEWERLTAAALNQDTSLHPQVGSAGAAT
jgi:membrane protein